MMNNPNHRFSAYGLFGAALMAVCLTTSTLGAQSMNIAILKDGDSLSFDQITDMLKTQLNILAGDEWALTYVEGPEFNADWNPVRAGEILHAALGDTNIHLIFANGLLVSRQAIQSPTPLNKPVVSGFVDDPDTLGLPISDTRGSTISNYTFVVIPCDAGADLKLFHALVPFNRLTVLVDEYYLKNIPELKTRADAYEKETGIRLDLVSFATTAEKTMAGIPPDAQAVYITPSVIMDDAELGRLIGFINARKLPSFSMMGEIDVEQGVLAGQRSGDPIRIIRRLALNIQQILLGASPETLPVVMDDPLRTVLNARTARQIGVDLPYALLLTAQIIHSDELEIGKPLNLSQAYQMALESNPAITGGREEVKKSEEDRLRARSSLFPQVNGNLQYAQIDEDRARSSMGLQPWKSKTGGFGLTQIIFNDPAISGFRAYSRLYQSKRFEQTNLELDTLTRVGEAYINLLTRRALLQIDIDNYGLIQNYLDLAKNRYKSGVAGPEEIYRWETQLTSARSSLLNSQAQLSIAQTLLNQTLGADMNALWNPADEQQLVESNPFFAPRFTDLINSDRQFDALRTFLRHYA
ncbi:MAG: TolC family protein, partial [Kiritimatiellae bacterium]|nr:TolC family protein [Kiritimatiellia bacterium]